MRVDNYGVVIWPKCYLGWSVELVGDTDDTSGFYIMLLSPDIKEKILYWDVKVSLILQHLADEDIQVNWEKNILIENNPVTPKNKCRRIWSQDT